MDAFVHDRATGETARVSVASDGAQATWESLGSEISADGRFVAFWSRAVNFAEGDTNDAYDVFVHDRDADENGIFDEDPQMVSGAISTERVSIASDGAQAISSATHPKVSADGRFVAFNSYAGNLVEGDTNGISDGLDVFVHDRATGETTRVSVASDGAQTNGNSNTWTISADGRFVGFDSWASNLVEGDANDKMDAFVHDRATGQTMRMSIASDGGEGNDHSEYPVLSADGRFVAFWSRAVNFVEGDTNFVGDVFVRGPDPGDLASDLTGDSDLDDTVLQVIDTQAPSPGPVALGAAVHVTVSAGAAAFLVPEFASGVDRNLDGDTDDGFVHLSVDGGAAQDLDKEAVAIAMSSELIYDWASPSPAWTALGPEADLVDAVGSAIALRAATTQELHTYDAATATLTALGQMAEEFVLGEQIVAFRTSEAAQGDTDLNGDGDTLDHVLGVYDLVSGELFNTGQAVIPCRLQACDPRIPYRVTGDTVTFLTLEADQGGQDLDGNGDANDVVLQTFNARQAAEAAEESGVAARSGRLRFVAAREIAGTSVMPIAGTSAGVCTATGEACASDADCPSGICFVPPGGCIEDLGTCCGPCDPYRSCGTNEFCVPILGAGGTGTCHVNRGACASGADCTAPAVCEDALADIVRLFGPLNPQSDGRQLFLSAGLRSEATGSACLADDDCAAGEVCNEAGACQEDRRELIVANAPDTDGDGVADPFDNCPHRPNTDQADNDGDGVGNACNRIVCRDGIDNDGDGATDLDDDGCRSADDPSEERDCNDGIDNDNDGVIDYPDDPGCFNPYSFTEKPQCQDGVNNDSNQDRLIDYDGGQSIWGQCTGAPGGCPTGVSDPDGNGVANPDSKCVGKPWKNNERCGLGAELALLLPPLMWLWRRWRSRRGTRPGQRPRRVTCY
jgi:Tol biopolymer transport system component